MSDSIWFRPTHLSMACFFPAPTFSGWSFSECGSWRVRVALRDSSWTTKMPDADICPACARKLGLQLRPVAEVTVPKQGLFTAEERRALLEDAL